MANEVLIGTSVPNTLSNLVVSKSDYPTVSGNHAKVSRGNDGKLYIEDLHSTNGTYINNRRVLRSPISSNSHIRLGSNYILPLNLIIPKLPITDDEFNRRMNQLRSVWENHQESVRELNLCKQKVGSRRMLPTMTVGLFASILALPNVLNSTGMMEVPSGLIKTLTIIGAIGSLIGGSGYFFMGNIITNKMREIDEELAAENERFQLEYECPACHRFLGNTSWGVISSKGECPCCHRTFNPRG